MTDSTRKVRKAVTPGQRLEYAKLMVEEQYTNQQVMDLSGAGAAAVYRWKKQYIAEQQGEVRKAWGSSCLLHNTLDQSLNSRPKLAIFSFALADLVGKVN
jgi:predicted transcriptional regulator